MAAVKKRERERKRERVWEKEREGLVSGWEPNLASESQGFSFADVMKSSSDTYPCVASIHVVEKTAGECPNLHCT